MLDHILVTPWLVVSKIREGTRLERLDHLEFCGMLDLPWQSRCRRKDSCSSVAGGDLKKTKGLRWAANF